MADSKAIAVLRDERLRDEVARALPSGMSADQMLRIALTQVRLSPDLQRCTPESLMGALLQAAQAGLRPGMFDEGWLIGRWSKRARAYEATFQPGYGGLLKLALQSGDVTGASTGVVHEGDAFSVRLGSDPYVEHVPALVADPGEVVAFYASLTLRGGGRIVEVMRRAEVDAVRDRYAPRDAEGHVVGPWATHYEAMGRKTVLLRALKLAPKSSDRLLAALQADQASTGVAQPTPPATPLPARLRVAEKLGITAPSVDREYEPETALEARETARGSATTTDGPATRNSSAISRNSGDLEPDDIPFGDEAPESEPQAASPLTDEPQEDEQFLGPREDDMQRLAQPKMATRKQIGKLSILCQRLEDHGVTEHEWRAALEERFGTGERSQLTIREASDAIDAFEGWLATLDTSKEASK